MSVKLTKQRTVFLGILGLAGTALAADRLFLGTTGPASAAAESLLITPEQSSAERLAQGAGKAVIAGAPASSPSPLAASTLRAAGTGVVPVADRLHTLVLPTDSPNDPATLDAFRVPASWGDPFSSPKTAESAEAPEQFNFRLAAVLKNRADGSLVAAINGRAYRVGDTLDGCEVMGLTADGATIRTPKGRTIELRIPQGMSNDQRSSPARNATKG